MPAIVLALIKFADNSIVSNPGSPIHILYAPKVDSEGCITLVETGVENTDDYIQSFVESTDMEVIVNRIMNGEEQLLRQRTGSFGDFTKMPKTYAEMLQLQLDSNRLFMSLPVEVREKFNHDPAQFMAQSGTEDWFKKIENVLPDEVKSVVFPQASAAPVESESKE